MKEYALAAPTASQKKQGLGVAAVIIALFLAAVDSTIVSTVLPAISNELGHPALYPWVMSAFLLPVALVAPLAGACSDKLGVSTTLKVCLSVFLAASILAAISASMPVLILARALQGAGAGGIIVLSYSLLAVLFDAEKRGKMQGMLSGVWGLSAILGPLLGSVLANTLGWRTIFWFNIPVGLLALSLLFVTPTVGKGAGGKARLDLLAQLLLIVLACSLLLLISQPEVLKGAVRGLWAVMLVALLLLVLRVRQRPESSPIPLQFFQRGSLLSVIILVLLSSAGLYSSVTLMPLALSQQMGSVVSSGLLIMLTALGWVVGAAVCGNKLATLGYLRMALLGMLMLSGGAFLMVPAVGHHHMSLMAFSLALIGLGMGFTATTTLVFAQNAAPADRLGSWTATVQFLRNLGAALGVNTLATVQLHLAGAYAFQVCFIILGVSMLVGLVFSLLLPRAYSAR
ncbi:MFS transporter [Serratia plymuthica]|uniref:MFS transporter n=1 Tax=Serratia plymuthica TaxID=82996 RepID=UPI001F53A004|nr:MFS transporter [Serratia plymuthica]UNK29777.1 MFS transporter [Serratia plymuthica]